MVKRKLIIFHILYQKRLFIAKINKNFRENISDISGLRSAYNDYLGREPKRTGSVPEKKTFDYIFLFDGNDQTILKVMDVDDVEKIVPASYSLKLPNDTIPSDHAPLGAVIDVIRKK
jgi:hypothetical protein